MSHQHTPGPWNASGHAIYAGQGVMAVYVAQCWAEATKELPEYAGAMAAQRVPENDNIADANARLIAAAPDLLAMLIEADRRLSFYVSQQHENRNDLRALIAETQGNSNIQHADNWRNVRRIQKRIDGVKGGAS